MEVTIITQPVKRHEKEISTVTETNKQRMRSSRNKDGGVTYHRRVNPFHHRKNIMSQLYLSLAARVIGNFHLMDNKRSFYDVLH